MESIPDHIMRRLEHNERIAARFHEIEVGILSILNFKDFFENLLSAISKTFQVPHVWISVIEESSMAGLLKEVAVTRLLKLNTGFLDRTTFHRIVGEGIEPLLANREMYRFKPLFPPHARYRLGSIAIAPITLDGEPIGSLNQGDIDPMRYKPGIDTALLERLALKISLCLSNVAAHEQLRFLAFHDPLTGLLNRRVMTNILEREVDRARRYDTDLTVVFMDLDKFKAINDTYGHDQGDAALVHMASVLNRLKRSSDSVARFAGDEFVAILPSTSILQAKQFIFRLQTFLKSNPVVTPDGQEFLIGATAGAASIREPDMNEPSDLLARADERLYQLKKQRA